ncbi:MAG: M20/M25/M40 family metallo-hydrolase [Gammaproteobacteria bacterium]|nr:M20/M25/M40 family metallo-hydrolase [Gammaproteobacteria bacterium]
MKNSLLITLLGSLAFSSLAHGQIELKDVTQDITFLASDDLKGRQTFTAGIDNAGQYIATSFKQAGLVPLSGLDSFHQSFSLYSIVPRSNNIILNGTKITSDNVMTISSFESLKWNNTDGVNVRYIRAEDKFSKVMAQANSVNGDSLIIVAPIHQESFTRYKKHFDRGLNKLASNAGASAVVVLSDIEQLNQFDLSVTNDIKQQALANIVGVLPGSSKADEIILYSAHYDHLGQDSSLKGDTIYNGADDDASGTSAIMALAKHFSQQGNNARTLMFVAFTAEEIGGFGSQYFSNKLNPASITAMINIEMIGKPSKFGAGTFWMTGFERSDLGAILNRNLATISQQVYPDPYPKQKLFYRSDNATLARLGVPAHSVSSTQLDQDKHYHNVSDDINSLDLVSMTKVINAIAVASESLVNGKDAPSRLDASKVKKAGTIF